ncbi:sugar kinase [uncultured Microbacterium sp.]|uniref:sugar kinase n=1 Tax=uncultured Microbacterium sp. TaxID=191216 RepID=UPI0035CC10DF
MSEVVTFGETMALFSPRAPGAVRPGGDWRIGIGGAESNVAIGLARLGTSVTWIGRVGDDALGGLVTREIRAEGVDAVGVVDAVAPTGLMIKERPGRGRSRVRYYRAASAGSRLSPADVPDDVARSARLVHVTGITPALSESAAETARHALRIAREAGVTTSFDLNYRSALWSRDAAAAAFRGILPLVDIVFAGDDEAAIVVGEGEPEQLAERLAQLGPRAAVIKLGEHGAFARVDGQELRQAAFPVDVVDTVGAGDAFVAGFLSEHLLGGSPAAALRVGALAGAFACESPGDWEGLPTRGDLDEDGSTSSADPVQR